jgi:hypothetical protein
MEPLLTMALQGTARQAGSRPETGTPIDELWQGSGEREPERRLLLAAGALASYLQAGQRAETIAAPIAASPPETLAVLQGRQARLVWDLLHQRFPPVIAGDDFTMQAGRHSDLEYQAVLAEALTLVARAGYRLPEHMLPQALANQDAAVREALLPVLGERGRWLAALNPAWRWAAARPVVQDADLETTWLEGLPAQRLVALARMRASDPAAARQWLATSWKSEGAEFRHDALGALEAGLSLEDEPFLEAALDDRSERVRARAAQVLVRLPDSALAGRMRERAATILTYDPAGEKLLVTLPNSIDAAWQRDGVTPKPPRDAQVDQQVWWTMQTLALVSPAYWSARFNRTPDELIAAATKSQWIYEVLEGWSQAAIALRDDLWSGPLWDCWRHPLAVNAPRLRLVRDELLTRLLTSMPPAEAEQRLARMPSTSSNAEDYIWRILFAALQRPWSPGLSRACLERIRTDIEELTLPGALQRSGWFAQIDLIAVGIAPMCFGEALALLSAVERAELSQFRETIMVRRMLHAEFRGMRSV